MKKDNVKVGSIYAVKVSGSVVPVRLDRESPHGGWLGVNMKTHKEVRVKSAQRLRGLWPKKTMPITPEAAQAIHHADQENARLDEERSNADDGQTASERAMATSAPAAKKGRKASKDATDEPGRDTGEPGNASAKPKRLSILDAAARVLDERDPADGPLSCKQMIERMQAKGYWEPRKGGLTPANTLYSALLREIRTKGEDSRFDKVERGKFSLSLKN
jgi:hypothetical protein